MMMESLLSLQQHVCLLEKAIHAHVSAKQFRIINFLKERPYAVSKPELRDKLKLNEGDITYHLFVLTQKNIVYSPYRGTYQLKDVFHADR